MKNADMFYKIFGECMIMMAQKDDVELFKWADAEYKEKKTQPKISKCNVCGEDISGLSYCPKCHFIKRMNGLI